MSDKLTAYQLLYQPLSLKAEVDYRMNELTMLRQAANCIPERTEDKIRD